MDAILQVLEKLLDRTNENKIPWKTTVNERSFTASFGATSVLIEKYPRSNRYELTILDEAGGEIESVLAGDHERDYDMYQDLFDKARRYARDTDNKLEALLAELDQV
jgi:hypothetical protein